MGKQSKNSGKLSQRELDICARVRELRLSLKWDQPDFAKALQITRERLASYEYGRAPIRYWLAAEIGRRFDINQRWLATGQKPMKFYVDVSLTVEGNIDPRMLFCEAYDKMLKQLVEDRLHDVESVVKVPAETFDNISWGMDWPAAGSSSAAVTRYFLVKIIQTDLAFLPDGLQEAYSKAIVKAAKDFLAKKSKAIEKQRRVTS